MKKKLFSLLLITYCLLLIAPAVHADYVLPYPSYMPGNKMYRISRVVDRAKGYWYWGNIAQFKYHLALSDKYLVEAKTLMEYNQYLLGADALRRSDKEFGEVTQYVKGAKQAGIDIIRLKNTVQEAATVHDGVLSKLLAFVPNEFTWTPEKEQPTRIPLRELLTHSKDVRVQTARGVASL